MVMCQHSQIFLKDYVIGYYIIIQHICSEVKNENISILLLQQRETFLLQGLDYNKLQTVLPVKEENDPLSLDINDKCEDLILISKEEEGQIKQEESVKLLFVTFKNK